MNRELPARFTKQYILERVVEDENKCWIWQKSKHDHGYGQLGVWPYTSHVLAYLLWRGSYEEPVLRHSCHVPACCNPEHLFPGTHKDNWEDSREVHRKFTDTLKGRRAPNTQRVRIYGVEYDSKDQARTALKISYSKLTRDCEVI